MKGLVVALVLFVVLVVALVGGLISDAISTALLAFCGLALWGWPMLVLAIYRVVTGRTEDGRAVAIISPQERAILAKYRQRQGEA